MRDEGIQKMDESQKQEMLLLNPMQVVMLRPIMREMKAKNRSNMS